MVETFKCTTIYNIKITFLGQVRNIDRRHKDRQVGTVDGNANREHYGHCRADTHIQPIPCGQVSAPVPSSPDMDIHVGKSGSIFYLPASKVTAIRPMVLRHTGSVMGLPKEVATPRSSQWPPNMPSNLKIASPVKDIKND